MGRVYHISTALHRPASGLRVPQEGGHLQQRRRLRGEGRGSTAVAPSAERGTRGEEAEPRGETDGWCCGYDG